MFFMTRLKMNRREAEWTKGSRPSLTPSSVTHYFFLGGVNMRP